MGRVKSFAVICLAAVFATVSFGNVIVPGDGVEYIKIDLPEFNHSLNAMTNGGTYGTGGDYLSLNGNVPFTIADGTNGAYNIWPSMDDSTDHSIEFCVSQYGAISKVHTFINIWYGSFNANIGTITFTGSAGAVYSVDLIVGQNVRDHYQGYYVNQILSPTTSLAYSPGSGVILDRQEFVLPEVFSTQSLTGITITDTNFSDNNAGKSFLTAVTLERAIPEPMTLSIFAAGMFFSLRKIRH